MSRYDGLIIPRSYSEYINKTDAATLQQALQLSGVLDSFPTENSNNPVKSGGVFSAIDALKKKTLGQVQAGEYIDITVPQYKVMLIHTRPYNGGALLLFAMAMYTSIFFDVLINEHNNFSVTTREGKLRITNTNTQYPFYIEGVTF